MSFFNSILTSSQMTSSAVILRARTHRQGQRNIARDSKEICIFAHTIESSWKAAFLRQIRREKTFPRSDFASETSLFESYTAIISLLEGGLIMKQVKGRLPNSSALNWILKSLWFEFILTQTRAEPCSQNGLSIIFLFRVCVCYFISQATTKRIRANQCFVV